MASTQRHTYKWWLAAGLQLLLLAALCGCSASEVAWTDDEAETLELSFTLSVGQTDGATRAGSTWGDSYEAEESDYDDAVDPERVTVFIVDAKGKAVTRVDDLVKIYLPGLGYQYYAQLPRSLFTAGETYRCMVTANCTPAADYDATSALTYDTSALPASTTATHYVPMWGVQSFTPGGTDLQEAVGSIRMLKAAAKCRLSLTSALCKAGYKFKSAKLHYYNRQGDVLPVGYNAVSETRELSFVSTNKLYCFNPTSSTRTNDSLTFHAEPGVDGESQIVYFPEVTNTAQLPTYITLTIEDKDGYTSDYEVEFKNYTTEALVEDLMRNNVYDFVINGFTHGLSLKLTVSDWVEEAETWDFTDHILVAKTLEWDPETCSAVDTKDQAVTVLKDVAAEGRFCLTSPEGALWVATVTPTTYFGFETGEVDADGNPVTASTITGTIDRKEAVIRIRALTSGSTTQNEAKLTFYVYYKDGTTRLVEELSGWEIIQPL
jgi:hypothetical protein